MIIDSATGQVRELSPFTGRGTSVCGGGSLNIFKGPKGVAGQNFFKGPKEGDHFNGISQLEFRNA